MLRINHSENGPMFEYEYRFVQGSIKFSHTFTRHFLDRVKFKYEYFRLLSDSMNDRVSPHTSERQSDLLLDALAYGIEVLLFARRIVRLLFV